MTDLEQWVKAQADIIAGNSYPGSSTLIGKNKGFRVSEGQFMQFESITRAPLEMPQVQRQVAGHPFWISETLWPHPHESANEHLGITAIALDQKPLAESGKIFVQISPRARPTGWKLEPATHQEKDGPTLQGWRITDTGEAPFRLETIQGRIAINNPGLTTATVLDPLGQPGNKLPLKRNDATASLTLPTSAIYLILD